jgi:hypothetical protein
MLPFTRVTAPWNGLQAVQTRTGMVNAIRYVLLTRVQVRLLPVENERLR